MQRERDILHTVILPELRQIARAHDADLCDVDLQWGVAATPDVTDDFLDVVASELSRTAILVALLNGDSGFREEPVEKAIRTLQIYIALMSKTTRLVPLIRQGGAANALHDPKGEEDALRRTVQTDIAMAARLRERSVNIASYSSLENFPEAVMNLVLPILHADYFSKIGSVFVSYSGRDNPVVNEVARSLRQARFDVWIDEANIPGGRSWRAEIAKAIGGCDAVLFLINRAAVSSEPCLEEVALARSKRKPVLSAFLEPVDLPDELELMLSRFQHVSYHPDTPADLFSAALGHALQDLIAEARRG